MRHDQEDGPRAATNAASLLAEAKQRSAPFSVDHLARALDRGEAVLIDPREPDERAQQGAIPGAVPAPWGRLQVWEALTEAHYRAGCDLSGRVVLYCAAGERW